MKNRFPVDATRALDWMHKEFARAAVGWVHIPTGNLVLVEALCEFERAGTVQARAWIAATDTLVSLTSGIKTKFSTDTEAEMNPGWDNQQTALERITMVATQQLDLPTPELLKEAAQSLSGTR